MSRWIRFRLGLIYVLFGLFLGFIGFRLLQLQVWPNPELDALARRQFERPEKRSAYRLPLLDRNGEELAVSTPAFSIFAHPAQVTKKRTASRALAKILGGNPAYYLAKLESPKAFVWIRRQVDEAAAKKLEALKLPGLGLEAENRRNYPNGSLAAHVIGFTDIDGNGLAGLEKTLNGKLLTQTQAYRAIRDGRGSLSYVDSRSLPVTPEKQGIYTSLDKPLQFALEGELAEARKTWDAANVLGIVMNPHTGEILALAQSPTFDLNKFSQAASSLLLNQVTSGLYEPGSTLKALFFAAALEEGLLTAKTPIYCGNGTLQIGNKTIREAQNHKFGTLPAEKILHLSSNVGAANIAQKLGAMRARKTLERFGLTEKTGVDLPGESVTSLRSADDWNLFYLSTVGFGQGVAFTPLQMVRAYAVFANGGYLVEPTLLKNEGPEPLPESRVRVLTPKTAEIMNTILAGVTAKGGTGEKAAIPGVVLAGKTATAQKFTVDGGYENGKYFSSFIGYFPVDHPQFIIGVMVDEPTRAYYAAEVAVPLFKRVAEQTLVRFNKTTQLTHTALNNETEREQVTELTSNAPGEFIMPNLKGRSLREVLEMMGPNFPHLKISGTGFVSTQSPDAGTSIDKDSSIELELRS